MSAGELAAAVAAGDFKTIVQLIVADFIFRAHFKLVLDWLELALGNFFFLELFQQITLFIVLLLTHFSNQFGLEQLRFKSSKQGRSRVIELLLKRLIFDELSSIRNVDSLLDLLVRSLHVAVEDVLFYRVVEQSRLLHHQAHRGTKLGDVVVTHIHTVDQNLAEVRVVEPHDQADQR